MYMESNGVGAKMALTIFELEDLFADYKEIVTTFGDEAPVSPPDLAIFDTDNASLTCTQVSTRQLDASKKESRGDLVKQLWQQSFSDHQRRTLPTPLYTILKGVWPKIPIQPTCLGL